MSTSGHAPDVFISFVSNTNLIMRHAILVAGGTGSRMGSELPKQFITLQGIPVLGRTILRFKEFDPEINIVVVVHPDFIDYWRLNAEALNLPEHTLVAGGETRFHSVQNGLNSIEAERGVVAVHDAVRMFVSDGTLERCFGTASELGTAVPIMPVVDSLRQFDGEGWRHVERKNFVAVQTPQCFSIEILREAYCEEYNPGFTDDASVVESIGFEINMVEGNQENVKLTNRIDLLVAEALLNS